MAWVGAYQYGTAIVLAAVWLLVSPRGIGRYGLFWIFTAPLFFIVWWALEFLLLL
ncbi:hypothetical protein BH10PSE5_BH10PSE5_13470 [soil metagenome]